MEMKCKMGLVVLDKMYMALEHSYLSGIDIFL